MRIMRVSQTLRFAILAGAAMAVLAAMRLPGAADDLVAHHATYTLSLAPGSDSGVSDADGSMEYDQKDTCDGWATTLKFKVIVTGDNGGAHTVEVSQVLWEAKGGKAFRFLIKNAHGDGTGDQQSDQSRGEARIDSAGNASVIVDQPTQSEAKLPAGILFPLGQTAAMLKKAAAGETFFSAEVFDGTLSTQAAQETALIGAGEKDWNGLGKKFPELTGLTSYPVGLAYFVGDSTDSTPDNEQTMRIFSNGVVGLFDFDFGQGIKIRALLNDLKLQPAPGC